MWITFNEPYVLAVLMETGPNARPYDITHNIIKSHAKAYHVYNTEFRGDQKGENIIRADYIFISCYIFYITI